MNHIIIGQRNDWGRESHAGMPPEEARHHTYLIGQTGSGKTTLLRNLILQHLEAGHGLALIDPHGDLAEELLDLFPPHRANDLVYFNPADLDFPVSVNPLPRVAPDERHRIASGVTAAFKSLWRDSWGPRLEYLLYNSLQALLECPNTSLLGVTRLLSDPVYRQWVVRQVRDPFVRSFWTNEFERYDERFLREAIAPVQNKIGQLLMSPPVRNVLGQVRTPVDFRFLMDTGRVFIANLSKGRLGEDKANLLGSLLATSLHQAALSRADTPESERRDFHLFIDEFQNFTTDSFASMLAESRKYRLCLTLAHQYLDQLSPEVRSAVFGNVGTMVVFRVGSADAELIAGEFAGSHVADQFVDLDRYEVLVRPLVGGVWSAPFRATTLPPVGRAHSRRDRLIRHSRERFATPRQKVEDRLARWLASPDAMLQ